MARRYSGWKDPPPVTVIGGTEPFLRRRELQRALLAASTWGRRVETLTEFSQLDGIFSSSMLFADPFLVILSMKAPKAAAAKEEGEGDKVAKDKVDIEEVVRFIQTHLAEDDNQISVVFFYEGACPEAISKAVPPRYRFLSDAPAPYKAAKESAEFIAKEVSRSGKSISEPLALALVNKVGTDLGVLYFEVVKVLAYMNARGEGPEVTADQLRATLVQTGEVTLGSIVEAVGEASVPKLLRALEAARLNTGKADETMMKTLAWLGKQVVTWLHVAALDAQGSSPEEGIQRTGLKPHVYSNLALPVARRWKVSRLMLLLNRLAKIQVAIRSGHIDPWTELECALVASCHGVARRTEGR
jgi:hypothetical protein